jgi:hypothetical protein
MWLGDFPEDHASVVCMFTTHAATGAPVAPSTAFEAADVLIYKNGGGAQKTTANGVTMTSPFDTVTGLHCVTIDTSNDTGDAAFWAAGAVYTLVLSADETVDSVAVAKVIGQFGLSLAGVDAVPTAIENADALLNRDMSTGTDSGSTTVRTVRQALRFLRNKWSISAGVLTVTKEDDATASWTSAVTGDASVTASDPAGP